jgi:hypothetical protein
MEVLGEDRGRILSWKPMFKMWREIVIWKVNLTVLLGGGMLVFVASASIRCHRPISRYSYAYVSFPFKFSFSFRVSGSQFVVQRNRRMPRTFSLYLHFLPFAFTLLSSLSR